MENEAASTSRITDEPSSVGLSIVANPDEATVDCVFIHGFNGHPVRTWTHKTEYVIQSRTDGSSTGDQPLAKKPRLSGVPSFIKEKEDRRYVYWPRDVLPNTLPTARVLVYGYDTKVRHSLDSSVSKSTVYDIAFDFL